MTEIEEILSNGSIELKIGDEVKSFGVEVYFCSDYGFLAKWLGVEPKAKQFCAFCEVEKTQIHQCDDCQKRSFDSWITGKDGIQVMNVFAFLML